MNQRDLILYYSTLTFQGLLVAAVYVRHLQRRLPFFAAYATLALGCSIVAGLIYGFLGIRSQISYYAYWVVVGVEMIARCLVVAELCRYRLREYPGIWALTARLLILLTLLFLGHAAWDAWGQPNRFIIYSLTFERDINISSVAILGCLLLIRDYYGLPLDPLHKLIAAGLCFYCIVDTVNSTVLTNLFTGSLFSWFSIDHMPLWPALKPQVERVKDLWTTIRFTSYMVSMAIWCFALRKPLPEPARAPELLPAEVYAKLSPAISVGLRAFNDRIEEMLKP